MFKVRVCGLFAVLLGLLATGSSIVFSSSAYAYGEDFMPVTSDFSIKSSACGSRDMRSSFLTEMSKNAQFSSVYDTDAHWALSLMKLSNGDQWVGFNFLNNISNPDGSSVKIDFHSRSGESSPGTSISRFDGSWYMRFNADCSVFVSSGFSGGQITYATSSGIDMKLFATNFEIVYPDGYNQPKPLTGVPLDTLIEPVDPNALENCEVYNGDIFKTGEFFGCQFGNMVKNIKLFFTPNADAIGKKFDELFLTFKEKTGFVWQGIDILVKLFQSLVSGASSGNCYLRLGTLNGSQVALDGCAVSQTLGAGWDIGINLFRGSIIYSIAFQGYRYINNKMRGDSDDI